MAHDIRKNQHNNSHETETGATGKPATGISQGGMTNDLDAGPATLGGFRRLQDRNKFKKAWR